MTDIEGILDDMSYLIALDESKRSSDVSDRKSTLVLPSYLVYSYVNWWMKKYSIDSFTNIFEDEIEMYFFKNYIDTNLLITKNWKELEQIHEIEECLLSRKKSTFTLTNEMIKEYEWNKIDPHITDYVDDFDEENFVKFIQDRKAALHEYFDLVFIDFVKDKRFHEYTRWKYLEITLKPKIDDFYTHRLLGMGGFGEVCAVNHVPTGKIYALKTMNKRKLKLTHCESIATNERHMMTFVESDFIVNLIYAFQDSKNLYLVMDLMDGGDLAFHIRQRGSFSFTETVFYSAQIILGLEYLHNRNIAYLDLKPNNILLDSHGHSRISDLGLACHDHIESKSRRYTYTLSSGTVGYMAPEVINGKIYNHVADYYSLGSAIIKMIHGKNVLHAKQNGSKYVQIEPKFDELAKILPPQCYSIVVRFLEKDPCLRLGAPPNGIDEIKTHEMYSDLNWKSMYNRLIPPPIVPARNQINTDYPSSVNSSTIKNLPKLSDEDQKIYNNFNYVHEKLWRKEIMESVFMYINNKNEQKLNRKTKLILESIDLIKNDEEVCCFGEILEYSSMSLKSWKPKCCVAYKNRIEIVTDFISNPKEMKYYYIAEIKLETIKSYESIILIVNQQKKIFRGITNGETHWWYDNLKDLWVKRDKFPSTFYVHTSFVPKYVSEQDMMENISDFSESTTIWET